MLVVLTGWLIMTCNDVMMGVMLMAGCNLMHVVLVDLRNHRVAVTAGSLHRNRSSHGAAAE